jgi:cytochrome d ubiquinol oxidase subunit I
LRIGGWPDVDAGRVHAAIEIPGGLSFLAFGDPSARVRGLEEFPRTEWPPVARVHVAFQLMVGSGTTLAALGALGLVLALRRRSPRPKRTWSWSWKLRLPDHRPFLIALVLAAPLGFVALEAGWLVTEWGRQPWIVRGLMRTADAAASLPHREWPFWVFTLVYLFLGVVVAYLLAQQIRAAHHTSASATGSAGGSATGPEGAHASV